MRPMDPRLLLRARWRLACCLLFASALGAQNPSMTETGSTADVVAIATSIVLCHSPVDLPLVPAAGVDALRRRLATLEPGRDVYLVVDGLRVYVDPGALYHVQLVGTTPPVPVAGVGSFSVFGVSHREGATAQRSFVVTSLLRDLSESRGGIGVRFVPDAAAAAGARVGIGSVSLVVQ